MSPNIDESEVVTRTDQQAETQDNEDEIAEKKMEEEGLNTHRIEREPVQFSNKTIKILKQG